MFDLSVKNSNGDILSLTRNNNFVIVGVSGITPAAANVNISNAGINDGGIFNSVRLEPRTIGINVVFQNDVENARINLYKYFATKSAVELHYKNGNRDVYVNGFVESFECDLFSNLETAQISVVCPSPWFHGAARTVGAGVPVSNTGDAAVGFDAVVSVTSSSNYLTLSNEEGFFRINKSIRTGDVVRISTVSGKKSVTLTRSGTTTNVLNALDSSSKWIQIPTGSSSFTVSGGHGVQITFEEVFAGV